jgi:Uncharacterized conserved protein
LTSFEIADIIYLVRLEGGLTMLDFIRNRTDDFEVKNFVFELANASKNLGILEAKIDSYQFNSILIPMLQKKEAISSMYIEGTQTTITDVLKNEICPQPNDEKIQIEVRNHVQTLIYGAEYLRTGKFTHTFMKQIHSYMMTGIIAPGLEKTLGKYKVKDNQIKSSTGVVVYTPPQLLKTKKYMDELLTFMNNADDGLHPLIKQQ